jgi:hypothetical protein
VFGPTRIASCLAKVVAAPDGTARVLADSSECFEPP